MSFPPRIELDIETGEIKTIPVDDAWILAHKPDRSTLELNNKTVSAQLLDALGRVKATTAEVTLTVRFHYNDGTTETESSTLTLNAEGQETIVLPDLDNHVVKVEIWLEEPDSNIIEVQNAS